MPDASAWNERTLNDGEWLRLDFAELTLVILSTMEEWRVAALFGDDRQRMDGAASPPDDLPWQRWDRGIKDTKISLRPVFPNRPIILRPRAPLNLSPRAKALFYVGIPAWIELRAEIEHEAQRLSAWPTARLSNTWHGTPVAGTLCYAARTRARRVFVPEEWSDFDIACSIEISNQSPNSLPFERLYFETDHLGIYEFEHQLWSNHARIRVGEKAASLSGIVFANRPYGDARRGKELTPPKLGRVRRSMLHEAFTSVFNSFQDD